MPDVIAQPAQAEAKTPPGPPSVEDCMALFRRGTALASDRGSIEQQTQGPIDISSLSEEEPAAETHSVEEEPATETRSVADTIEYDEFGCLIQTDLEEPAILLPNSKKRRLAALIVAGPRSSPSAQPRRRSSRPLRQRRPRRRSRRPLRRRRPRRSQPLPPKRLRRNACIRRSSQRFF
mmetsp:Transcript_13057/g.38882  ORF Transcript_13057/g.38882 Transcript_13057/m.38882 type:complete len:178 (-) Transcript_13057:22-555(-)